MRFLEKSSITKAKKRYTSEKIKISKIFRKMGIYILFFEKLYYSSDVIQIKVVQYVHLSIFLISLIVYNLKLATLVNLPPSSRNSNKEEKNT